MPRSSAQAVASAIVRDEPARGRSCRRRQRVKSLCNQAGRTVPVVQGPNHDEWLRARSVTPWLRRTILLVMLRSLDDGELLRVARRDPAAFGVFYERYEASVLVFMLRRTQAPEVAADLTAEVFAAALAGAARFRETGAPPAAWLFAIARNILADSYRSARVRDDARRKLGMPSLVVDDELAGSLDRLDAITAGRDALDLLEHLPDDQRDAIRARVLEDRDYGEIATELQCSASIVRKRVSRGLSALRNQLDPGAEHA